MELNGSSWVCLVQYHRQIARRGTAASNVEPCVWAIHVLRSLFCFPSTPLLDFLGFLFIKPRQFIACLRLYAQKLIQLSL